MGQLMNHRTITVSGYVATNFYERYHEEADRARIPGSVVRLS